MFHMMDASQIILPRHNLACITVKQFFTPDSLSCQLSGGYLIVSVLLFAAGRADQIS